MEALHGCWAVRHNSCSEHQNTILLWQESVKSITSTGILKMKIQREIFDDANVTSRFSSGLGCHACGCQYQVDCKYPRTTIFKLHLPSQFEAMLATINRIYQRMATTAGR